jgi:hypothetical protein
VTALASPARTTTACRLPGQGPVGLAGSGGRQGDAVSSWQGDARSTWQGDGGSAVVEFCLLAVLLLVPIIYLVLALGRIQAGAFAAQGAAREAGRAFVTAADEGSARGRADAAAAIAFADQGFSGPAGVGIEVACSAAPCLTPDQRVFVRSRVLVVLPGVPRLVDRFFPARVEVTARHVATVDRFRGRGPSRGEQGAPAP